MKESNMRSARNNPKTPVIVPIKPNAFSVSASFPSVRVNLSIAYRGRLASFMQRVTLNW
jgi:hypothetical protein